jgi:hypothetical protein
MLNYLDYKSSLQLLAGLFDADGTIKQGLKVLKITNEFLVRKVCLLSMGVGIPTKVRKYKAGITDNDGVRHYTRKNGEKYNDCYEIDFQEMNVRIPVLSNKESKDRIKLQGFSIDQDLAKNIYKQVLKLEGGYSKKNKAVVTWDNIKRGHSVIMPQTLHLELVNGIEPYYYKVKMRSKKSSKSKIYIIQTEKGNYLSSMISLNCNFGLIYGLSDKGLGEQLNISTKAAKKIKDGLFSGCTSLSEFFQACYDEVDASHEVVTIFGRTIPINMTNFKGEEDKEANHRRSVNYKVQSPSSDLVTDSIGRLYKAMKKKNMKSIIVGSVHDSILFDIYPGEAPALVKLVKHICETENRRLYPWIKCPIVVDFTMGTSWGGCLDFDVEYTPEGILLKCKEGLRKDFNMLFTTAEKAYKWEHKVISEEEILPNKQPKDKVIKDKFNWNVEILI